MGLFDGAKDFAREVFGNPDDMRVKSSKNTQTQLMLDYMYNKYDAFIEEHYDTRNDEYYYFIRCRCKERFDQLYHSGRLDNGVVVTYVDGDPIKVFYSKTEAYEYGLKELYYLFEGREERRRDLDADF